MVAFATPELMDSRTSGAITVASHPSLARELDAATQAIVNACGWGIRLASYTYTRRARIPTVVFLPAMQIVSVDTVRVNGVTIDPLTVEVDPGTGETNLYGRSIDVTYTAGFDPIPADLEQLTLDMVAAGLNTATGLVREQAGAVSLSYKEFAEAELHGRLSAYVIGWIP